VLPGVQPVKIGDAVDAEKDRLAIDDEGRGAVLQRRLNDQRIARGPIVAVAREQPDVGAPADCRTRAPSRWTIKR
jgi:hypothetical protein